MLKTYDQATLDQLIDEYRDATATLVGRELGLLDGSIVEAVEFAGRKRSALREYVEGLLK